MLFLYEGIAGRKHEVPHGAPRCFIFCPRAMVKICGDFAD